MSNIRILLAGEGGQGVQTIAEILARAAFFDGKHSTYIPNFGVEQRGGISIAFVRISNEKINYPKFGKADLMVVLCERAIERVAEYEGENTQYIYNKDLLSHKGKGIPMTTVADRINPKVFNMVVLGYLLKKINFKKASINKAIEEVLGEKFKKNPKIKSLNTSALEKGKSL